MIGVHPISSIWPNAHLVKDSVDSKGLQWFLSVLMFLWTMYFSVPLMYATFEVPSISIIEGLFPG